jgi:hypothetical protein
MQRVSAANVCCRLLVEDWGALTNCSEVKELPPIPSQLAPTVSVAHLIGRVWSTKVNAVCARLKGFWISGVENGTTEDREPCSVVLAAAEDTLFLS